MKKGTWVKFNFNGNNYIGIIVKGGKTVSVQYKDENGVDLAVQGSEKAFTPTAEPQMDTSSAMSAYSIKGFKEAGGEETVRFECSLYKNGKKIAIVSNGGYGGCNDYGWFDREAMMPFYDDTKQWAKDHGVTLIESHDTWIDWMNIARPLGVNATEYIQEFKDLFAEMGM